MPYVLEVTCSGTVAQGAVNVWHAQVPNSNLATEVSAVLTALDTFYEAVKQHLQMGTITSGSRMVTVDQNPNLEIPRTPLTCASTGVGQEVLTACVVCSHKAQALGGRYRGRQYIGPLDTGVVNTDGRTLQTTPANDFSSALATLFGTTAAGIAFGTWSRKYNSFSASTVTEVRGTIGTQRRRLN